MGLEQHHDERVVPVAYREQAGLADCGPQILRIRSTITYEASRFTIRLVYTE